MGKKGRGDREKEGKKPPGIGEEEKRGKNQQGERKGFKLLERTKKRIWEKYSFDPWDTVFKCQVKVLNTMGKRGKNKSGKNYCFVHCAQLGC